MPTAVWSHCILKCSVKASYQLQVQTEKSSMKEPVFFGLYYAAVFWRVIVNFVVLNKNKFKNYM